MSSAWKRTLSLVLMLGLLIASGVYFSLQTVSAAAPAQAAQPTQDPLTIGNDVCIGCHEVPGQSLLLENGELLDLTIYPREFSASIHGELGYACVQCHRSVGNYPHPAWTATSLREVTIVMNETCGTCHAPQVLLAEDSVHAKAMRAGQRQAAVCTDCHGAHDVQQWQDPISGDLRQTARLRIPQACANCHHDIYQKYIESIHGAALYDENNMDVPTCIDCHGTHNISSPATAEFRLRSPQMCAKCHTDASVMAKYALSTEVLSTYAADFHGTTVTVFEKQSPEAETNKPVCYDCHGIHDIRRVDDPQLGLQMQENLLVRCKLCHPEATANFPTAWLSHYIPSPENSPIVYYTNLFYKFFIPGVLGPMGALVALDVGHTLFTKYRRKVVQRRPGKAAPEPASPEEAGSASPALVLETGAESSEAIEEMPGGSPPAIEATDETTGEEVSHE